MLVRTEFQALLSSARRGEVIVYHTGFLLNDRQKGSQLEATADAAWAEHLAGRCTLVQRRLSPGLYEYIAIKLDPPKPVRYLGSYEHQARRGQRDADREELRASGAGRGLRF